MAMLAELLPPEQLESLRERGGSDEVMDLAGLTRDEIRAELTARTALCASISDQLGEDAANGYQMGHAARHALFADRIEARRETRLLRAELRDRDRRPVEDPRPVHDPRPAWQIEHERQQQAVKAARKAQRAAEQEALEPAREARQTTQNGLFIRAVRAELGKERFTRLWILAREMFPDDPAWSR